MTHACNEARSTAHTTFVPASRALNGVPGEHTVRTPFGTLVGTLHPELSGTPPVLDADGPRDAETPAGLRANSPIVVWPSLFSTAAVQHRMIEMLRRDGPVLALDPPGHGRSRIECADAMTLRSTAEATLALIDAAGLTGPVRLVGTSWGGLIGVTIAREHPERLAHLGLLNTPFAHDPGGWGKTRWLPLMVRWMGRGRIFSDGVARSFFLPATVRDAASAEAMAAHRATFANGDPRELRAAARHIFQTREDVQPWLADVAVPALVVAGRHDPMYDLDTQRDAARAMPLARLAVVDAAHIAAVDAPGEVVRLLREHWADHGAVTEDADRTEPRPHKVVGEREAATA